MLGRCWGLVGRQQWAEQASVQLGVENGDSLPLSGQGIRVRARLPFDEAVQAQAAQVVAHL